jgi:hypothetical protein
LAGPHDVNIVFAVMAESVGAAVRSANPVADEIERIVHIVVHECQGADDGNCNESCDQALFYSGRAAIILHETIRCFQHGMSHVKAKRTVSRTAVFTLSIE